MEREENLVEIVQEQMAECIVGSTTCDTSIDIAAMLQKKTPIGTASTNKRNSLNPSNKSVLS